MSSVEEHLKALMLRGLDGDSHAQTILLSDLTPLLRRFFAPRLGHDDGDIEDLVQECLIGMHVRRGSFDRASRFTPWAYAIARYKLIDHYRRKRVRGWAPLGDVEELIAPDTADQTMAARDISGLLGTLPAKQADAIRKTRIEGMSTEEAARATGMSLSAVKVSVHRGLKKLMKRAREEADRAD